MSGTDSTMKLGIDAAGAKQGADQFTTSINKITTAVDKLDRTTDVAFSKIKARLSGLDFSKVSRDVSAIGSIKVDGALAGNLTKLSTAIASFKSISPQTTSQLSAFAKALGQFHNPTANPTTLAALAAAVRGFRAPTQQQTANLQSFVHVLNTMKITANVPLIVSQLHSITVAAQQASAALAGVRGSGLPRVPSPRPPGGGGGNGRGVGGSYGPRGPYDGVFSGGSRATGELRGLENVANPSFQAASVMRAAVPALTSGAFIKSLYDEGQALTAFQHTLEIATTVPNDAIMSQRKLGDAMQFVSDLAMKYGLNLGELRQGFGLFAATAHVAGYTMTETKKVYEDTASSLRAVGASTEKQAQVWRALDTVMSQGFVSMLQLHRQIAPALPGVQISMAEVLFRAKNNLAAEVKLSAKQLDDAEKLLNDLSRKKQITPEALFQAMHVTAEKTSAGLPTALASPQSALERFKTQWLLTLDAMNKSGVWDAMGAQFNRFADMLRRNDIQTMFIKIAHGIADALKLMGDGVEWAANHMNILIPALKTFVMIGAAEVGLRLVTAFSSLGSLVGALISPFAQVVKLAGEFVSTGIDIALGKITLQAGLAAGAMRALGVATTLAMGVVGVAIIGATAIMIANENEMSAMGNRTQTFGEHMRTMWDMAKESGSDFGDWLLKLGQTFGMISGSANSWADVVESAMISIGTVVANLTINLLNDMRDIVAFTKNLPTNLTRMVLGGGAADYLGMPVAPPAEHIPNITSEDVRAGIVARTQDRLDRQKRIEAMNDSPNFATPVVAPTDPTINRPVIGAPAAAKGKSPAEKAQDAFDSASKSLTPDLAIVERYAEEVEKINKAIAEGVHSKGALDVAKIMGLGTPEAKAFLAGEYSRALDAAKDKVLESIHAVTPYEKELHAQATLEAQLTAAVRLKIITQQRANDVMKEATEHAKAILDPYRSFMDTLTKENSLLLLGNKEREVQTQLEEMIKKAKADGKALTDGEIAALKEQIQLHQKLQQYAANQNVGLQAWANSFQDLYTELGKVEQKIAGSLSSALSKFLSDGAQGFKNWKQQVQDLGKTILNDLMKTMTDSLMRKAMIGLGLIDEKPGADPKGASFLPQLFGVPKPDVPGQPGSGGGSWLSKIPIIGKWFDGGSDTTKAPDTTGKGIGDSKSSNPNTIEGAMAQNGGALPVVLTGKSDGVGGAVQAPTGTEGVSAGSSSGGVAGGGASQFNQVAKSAGTGGGSGTGGGIPGVNYGVNGTPSEAQLYEKTFGPGSAAAALSGTPAQQAAAQKMFGAGATAADPFQGAGSVGKLGNTDSGYASGASSGLSGAGYLDNGTWDGSSSGSASNDNTTSGAGYLDSGNWDTSGGSSGSSTGSSSSATSSSGIGSWLSKAFNGGGTTGTVLGLAGAGLGSLLGSKTSPTAAAAGGLLGGVAGKLLGSLFSKNGLGGSLFGSGSSGGGLFSSIGNGISSMGKSISSFFGGGSTGPAVNQLTGTGTWDSLAPSGALGGMSASDYADAGMRASASMSMGPQGAVGASISGDPMDPMLASGSLSPDFSTMDASIGTDPSVMPDLSSMGDLSAGLYSEGGYSTAPVSRSMMPSHAWAARAVPSFADGTGNTSGGMPAVLHPNEAVIPLSRGRKIPIEAANGNSMGGNSINMNFNVNANDPNQFRASENQINSRLGSTIRRAVSRNG